MKKTRFTLELIIAIILLTCWQVVTYMVNPVDKIHKDVSFIENIDFYQLDNGTYNTKQIIVDKNDMYPADKLVTISSYTPSYSYEVENDNGKSKVVVVFFNNEEYNAIPLHNEK